MMTASGPMRWTPLHLLRPAFAAIFLALAAAAVEGRAVTRGAPPMLNSIFVDFGLASSFTQPQWAVQVAAMQSLGIQSLTVAHVAVGLPWNASDPCFAPPHYGRYAALYPTEVNQCIATRAGSKGLQPLLAAAAAQSLQVHIGLANIVSRPGVGHFIYDDAAAWRAYTAMQVQVLHELWSLYGREFGQVIAGVYTVLESANCAPLHTAPEYTEYLAAVSREVQSYAPHLAVWASPAFREESVWATNWGRSSSQMCNRTLTPAEWGEDWERKFRRVPALTFVVPQDGRGSWNTESMASSYLDSICDAHSRAGRVCGVNLESFSVAGNATLGHPGKETCANRMPSPWPKFRGQLTEEAIAAARGMVTSWEWFWSWDPEADTCKTAGPALERLHSARAGTLRANYHTYLNRSHARHTLKLDDDTATVAGATGRLEWKATTGVKSCGDKDWRSFSHDPFGGGMDGSCALAPVGWPDTRAVAACEALCAPAAACVGFTLYPASEQIITRHHNQTSCCFRVGSVSDKPPCDGSPTCHGVRCYEKPAPLPPPPTPCHTCSGQTVFEPFLGGAPCWRIPSLVSLSESHLLAFAGSRCAPGDGCSPLAYNQSSKPSSHALIGLRRSVDRGRSWLPLQIVHAAPCRTDYRDGFQRTFTPQAVFHPQSGTVQLLMVGDSYPSVNSTVALVFSSSDAGLTWHQRALPIPIDPRILVGAGNGVVTSTGRIIFLGMIWPSGGAFMFVSDDAGRSFAVRKIALNLHQSMEPQVVELASGLYLHGRNPSGTGVVSSVLRSTSDGDEWQAVPLLTPFDLASCQGGLASTQPMYLNASAVGGLSDLVFLSHPNSDQRVNGSIFRSVDGGRSYSAVVQLTDATEVPNSRFSYSAMAALAQRSSGPSNTSSVPLGILYEAGDAEQCTFRCGACKIVYRWVEVDATVTSAPPPPLHPQPPTASAGDAAGRYQTKPATEVSVSAQGELQLNSLGRLVSSFSSRPFGREQQKATAERPDGEWRVTVDRSQASSGVIRVRGVSTVAGFSVTRTLLSQSTSGARFQRVLVHDNFSTFAQPSERRSLPRDQGRLDSSHVGLFINNTFVFGTRPSSVRLFGVSSGSPSSVCSTDILQGTHGNPSAVAVLSPSSAVGLMPFEDVLMTHTLLSQQAVAPCINGSLAHTPPKFALVDPHLTLERGDSYSTTWALYFTPHSSNPHGSPSSHTAVAAAAGSEGAAEWAFLNQLRVDLGSNNVTVEGGTKTDILHDVPGLAFDSGNWSDWKTWDVATMRSWLKYQGIRYAISTVPRREHQWPCTKNCSNWCHRSYCYGSCYSSGQESRISDTDMEAVAQALNHATKGSAGGEGDYDGLEAVPLIYFHPFISTEHPPSIDRLAGDSIMKADGTSLSYRSCAWAPMFLGIKNESTATVNPYGHALLDYVHKAMARGFRGIYMDESAWSGSPWNFNPSVWDRRSGQIDEAGHVSGLVSHVTLLWVAMKLELFAAVRAQGGVLFTNSVPTTLTEYNWASKHGRHGAAPSFVETGWSNGMNSMYWAALYTPIGLAEESGSQYDAQGGADPVGFLRMALDFGGLVAMRERVLPNVTGWRTKENVIRHLYPITPVQLGSGFVIGIERVVTKVSGEFSLPSDSSSRTASHEELVLRSFDGDGWLLATTTVTGPKVKVVVPPDGFAVITRHTNALWASSNE